MALQSCDEKKTPGGTVKYIGFKKVAFGVDPQWWDRLERYTQVAEARSKEFEQGKAQRVGSVSKGSRPWMILTLSIHKEGLKMADFYKVKTKVISQKGTCEVGHKVGDEFITSGTTPNGICLAAFNALYPSLWALMFGASFPWAKDPDTEIIACPDAENPVVFELQRIRNES
jgi:uncharacterized repeat protein (TIGR04076 family)